MDNLNKIVHKFTDITIKDARKNLSNNQRGKFRKINNTGKLSKSLKADIKPQSITFSMEGYGVDVDRGVLGQKKKILKHWNKSMFLPRGKGWTYAIKKGGQGTSKMMSSIKKWQGSKGVKGSPFAITRGIQLNGLTPKLFFTDSWDKNYPIFLNDIEPAIAEDIEIEIKT